MGFRLRYFAPAALAGACLVVLCGVTAVSLFRQQEEVTRVLRENVESRRVAVELEECLTDLIALQNDRVESVAVLHDRVRVLLRAVEQAADQPEERLLHGRLEANFAAYLAGWQALPPPDRPGREAARRDATRLLEAEVLRPCQEFKLYNGRRIEASAEHHERVLRQLAWGMAVVGGLGGVAGVVLGFGIARGLTRSLHRLQVRIRDAAGILAYTTQPEIVVIGEGGFGGLHGQMDRLTARIEQVVQQLQQREREVLRAEQLAAVGQLAAGVGHEIRNPLTSIKMLVQAGQEAGGGGLAADDLAVIEAEVRRMERSLQTFLDLARPPDLVRRPTDLGAAVVGVVSLVRGRADKQRVAVHTGLPADPVTVTADADLLRQVVLNLCLNALDAMPAGGTLFVTVRAGPAGRAAVEVADTGPGVSPAIRSRLFQPFASTKDTGLGLGLAISRRIVEDHGGTLTASDRAGGGGRFVVMLNAEG